MADDNKSCHCEFVPQDLTPGLKVTIRAIWYEPSHSFCFIRSSLIALLTVYLLVIEFILLFIHITFCFFVFLFICVHPRVKGHHHLLGKTTQSDLQLASLFSVVSQFYVVCH